MPLSREEITRAYDYACKRRSGRKGSLYLLNVLGVLDYTGVMKADEIKAFLKQKLKETTDRADSAQGNNL